MAGGAGTRLATAAACGRSTCSSPYVTARRRTSRPPALRSSTSRPDKHQIVMPGAAFGQYSPTGHLLFVKGGALSAAPFDLASRQVTGPARVVLDKVAVDPWTGGAHFASTAEGTLLFFAGRFRSRSAGWPGWIGTARRCPVPRSRRLSWGSRASPPTGRGRCLPACRATATTRSCLPISHGVRRSGSAKIRATTSTRCGRPTAGPIIWSALPPNRSPFLVMRAADGTSKTEAVLPLDRDRAVCRLGLSLRPARLHTGDSGRHRGHHGRSVESAREFRSRC